MKGLNMKEKILFIIVIGLLIISIILCFWYMISPSSVRKFCRKHPEWDRFGKMRNASDLYIRVSGIVGLIFIAFLAYGVLVVIPGI